MKYATIGEILDVKTGKYDANHAKPDGEYKFFTCALEPFMTDTFSFDDEVIILPGNGANVGQVLYYKGKLEAYQRTYILHNIKEYPRYLFYYFKKNWIYQVTKRQVGSATNYIKMDDIISFQIPLPPLESQKKIAAILDAADDLRQKDKALVAKYDELTQALFLDMFGDPVTNPKAWEVITIRDLLIEAKYGTSAKASDVGKYKYLRMNNITFEGYMDYANLKYIDVTEQEKEKYVVKYGDVLFNRTNSKELVGKTGIITTNEEMIIAGYLIRLRVNHLANPFYIWAHLNSTWSKTTLRNMCKSIVGMANINAQEVQDMPILKTPIKLQDQFSERVKVIGEQKSIAYASALKSEELFNSLLQKAFNGEL